MPRLANDHLGNRYGMLTVVERRPIDRSRQARWLVRCDCGVEKVVNGGALPRLRSCGCYRATAAGRDAARNPHRRHGHAGNYSGAKPSRTYNSWIAMIKRCEYTAHPGYENYGGRGISICRRWRLSFEGFLEDMGERPQGMTLDRYPNRDGNYEPGNCRWASPAQQTRNRRGHG